MSSKGIPKRRKIVILGSRSVGKSSLILQYIENHFTENYYPTIENSVAKTIKLNGVEYDCEIIDTAGQDEFSIFNSKHAIGIHGYVLVYSVASRNSFNMIQPLYDRIIEYRGTEDVPCVIVGSKSDLSANHPRSRQIEPSEGEKLAHQNHAAWIETSAKNNTNVGKVFDLLLDEIEKGTQRNLSSSEPPAPPKAERPGCIVM